MTYCFWHVAIVQGWLRKSILEYHADFSMYFYKLNIPPKNVIKSKEQKKKKEITHWKQTEYEHKQKLDKMILQQQQNAKYVNGIWVLEWWECGCGFVYANIVWVCSGESN